MIAWLESLSPAFVWALVGGVLVLFELVLPGFFLLWFGLSGLVTALVCACVPLNFPFSLLIFSAIALLTLFGTHSFYKKMQKGSPSLSLNRRGKQLVGQIFILDSAIVNHQGRLKVLDSLWSVRGPDCPAGTKVRVVKVEGNALYVEITG